MSHSFGDLLRQHLSHKHGLSQAKLAAGILQPPSVISEMCKGQRLVGATARTRVVAIIRWLYEQQALETQVEANAILASAKMTGLDSAIENEAYLLEVMTGYTHSENDMVLCTSNEQALPEPQETYLKHQRGNLPTRRPNFIGRCEEMAEVITLQRRSQLLTLTGIGGVGKTRLALEVAAEIQNEFKDGVWLIELAALNSRDSIIHCIANLLGLHAQADHSLLETVRYYLCNKQALLILDSCEHLVEECAWIAEQLLWNCHNLSILATSREGLFVADESRYPVPPLNTPTQFQQLEPEQILEFDAIRFFVDQVARVQPRFTLTQVNLELVVKICRSLDGIPLALELAAGRLHMLSLEELASQLDKRFMLLTCGSRTAPLRHRTLRALIDWSYNLLSENERQVLNRLSVFSDSWTLEAARVICGNEGQDEDFIFDAISQLVNKSLVVVTNQKKISRYHLLETVRQYALERLEESGEIDAIRNRQLLKTGISDKSLELNQAINNGVFVDY